eukprot:scaffold106_cov380-Prasinococcus_capsulatus_cf.AAC.58
MYNLGLNWEYIFLRVIHIHTGSSSARPPWPERESPWLPLSPRVPARAGPSARSLAHLRKTYLAVSTARVARHVPRLLSPHYKSGDDSMRSDMCQSRHGAAKGH